MTVAVRAVKEGSNSLLGLAEGEQFGAVNEFFIVKAVADQAYGVAEILPKYCPQDALDYRSCPKESGGMPPDPSRLAFHQHVRVPLVPDGQYWELRPPPPFTYSWIRHW